MSRDPPDDRYRGDEYDDAAQTDVTRPSTGGALPAGWPFGLGRDHDYEGDGQEYGDETDDSRWDEGLITLVVLAGVALFLFPEPATSALGMTLVVAAGIAWLVDWAA